MMKKLLSQKWFILLVLIIAAITSYVTGGLMGVGLLVVIGLGFELLFWRKLFSKNKP